MVRSKRPWLVVGAIAVVVAGVGLIVFLNDDDDQVATHEFGEGQVTVTTSEGASPVDQARATVVALIEQSGFPEEIVECYEVEVEGVPDSEFADLIELQQSGASDTELADAIRPLRHELVQKCFEPGETVDPGRLDENAAALIKEAFVRQLATGQIGGQRIPPDIAKCVAAKVRRIPAPELLALNDAPVRVVERKFTRLGRSCARTGGL